MYLKYVLSKGLDVKLIRGLSPTMRIFGTAINYDFGNVQETGLLIAAAELQEDKRVRYIDSFIKSNPAATKE